MRPWVGGQVYLFGLSVGHMRVHLSRRGAGVPKKLLHDTQVRAALEHVRCERVSQRMGMHSRADGRLDGVAPDLLLNAALAQAAPLAVQEQHAPAAAVDEAWAEVPDVEGQRRPHRLPPPAQRQRLYGRQPRPCTRAYPRASTASSVVTTALAR